MIHAREDYNRIQDPEGKIGEDEPVFLVRAHDKCAPATMRYWADAHQILGGDLKMAAMVREHANKAEKWQKEHGCKIADL